MPSALTNFSLDSAISPLSVSMSSFRVSMAAEFSSSFLPRLEIVSLKVFAETAHSSSSSFFWPVKSCNNVVKVSTIPWEWYLYIGSLGSTPEPVCKKALTAPRFVSAMRPKASASRRLCSTEARTASSAVGLLPSMTLTADSSEEMALLRSAAFASYSAFSLAYCTSVAFSSLAIASWSCLRCISSASFSSLAAVFSAIVAESRSMLSLPAVMASDLLMVVSLQKQANFS
mmetsp:Transcript_63895/g.161923  ORF Transcript_63895/g.161923 Transcript_63895/m.161923 type:complete len:230 (-) Transcript_63895:274-963(-)